VILAASEEFGDVASTSNHRVLDMEAPSQNFDIKRCKIVASIIADIYIMYIHMSVAICAHHFGGLPYPVAVTPPYTPNLIASLRHHAEEFMAEHQKFPINKP
jgi:hypothetical protein